MNNYYLTLVLKPGLEEKDRKALLDSVAKKLAGEDPSTGSGQAGKVEKEDLWGERDLAYPIQRQTKGFIAHYEIQADPKNAKGLDKLLKVEEYILRYLLVRV